MAGRSFMLAAATAVSLVSYEVQAKGLVENVRESVKAQTTLEGFALCGVVIPFAQEKFGGVVNDAAIPGVKTRVQDLWNAFVASIVATGWNLAHKNSDEYLKYFLQAVYTEFGYVGLQEIAKRLQLSSLFTAKTIANYNAFGVGYVKAAVRAVVNTIVESFPSNKTARS